MKSCDIAQEWVFISPDSEGLIDENGKVIAKVSILITCRTWLFNGDEYINKESAKRAAERLLATEEGRRGGRTNYTFRVKP